MLNKIKIILGTFFVSMIGIAFVIALPLLAAIGTSFMVILGSFLFVSLLVFDEEES